MYPILHLDYTKRVPKGSLNFKVNLKLMGQKRRNIFGRVTGIRYFRGVLDF